MNSAHHEYLRLTRGLSAQRDGNLIVAAECYAAVLRDNKLNPTAIHLLATVDVARGEYSRGTSGFLKSICLLPAEPVFLDNFRRLRLKWGGGNQRTHCQITTWLWRLKPNDVAVLRDLAVSRHELADFGSAKRAYIQAYLLCPDQLSLAVSAALCALQCGDFSFGWRWHDIRLRQSRALSVRFLYGRLQSAPTFRLLATGLTTYARPFRRVLVWGEQGIGDEVMFGGLLREFRDLCGEMLVQLDRRLVGLFERSLPGVKFFVRGEVVDESLYDEQIPIGSLGRYLRPSRESFEGKGGGYLRAKAGLREYLRERMGVGSRERVIGLSWKSAAPETGAVRSLGLEELVSALSLAGQQVRFVNLQYGDVAADIRGVRERLGIEVYSESEVDNREDLEGLAGLIEACDEVVSVGNATAHLAGALGKKALVLLPYVAGWRWLHEGDRCPWYDSVILLRQPKPEDWGDVTSRLGQALSTTSKISLKRLSE